MDLKALYNPQPGEAGVTPRRRKKRRGAFAGRRERRVGSVRRKQARNGEPHGALGRGDEQPVGDGGRVEVVLEPYEGRWLRVIAPGDEPFA